MPTLDSHTGTNETEFGDAAVVIPEGVNVYGGFGGWESQRGERNWGGFKPSLLTPDPVLPFRVLDRDQSYSTRTRCGYILQATGRILDSIRRSVI